MRTVVVEEFQFCDDALGKWVLRGVYTNAEADGDGPRNAAIEHLLAQELRGWGSRRPPGGDAELRARAQREFDRNWRTRDLVQNAIVEAPE